jgi:hypothetical protein
VIKFAFIFIFLSICIFAQVTPAKNVQVGGLACAGRMLGPIAAGNSTLTPEDQAALDLVTTNATALATRTKATADAVPDLPSVPPTA